MTSWHPAPATVPRYEWGCPTVDDDEQLCTGRMGHPGPHAGTGLREWLEGAEIDTFDRTYEGPRPEALFEMERPLMARFGYEASVVGQRDETAQVPNTVADYLFWGWPAPGRYERTRSLVVRYARGAPPPASGAWRP